MTGDDEAFIRAIVAAPGDDAPRLVYADWLDERSDPRGGYLRAELESHVARKRPPRVEFLDPVWVARVSRPPHGVCCDRVAFRYEYPLPTAANLDALERRAGVRQPVAYRAFLLNYNGGSPRPATFRRGDNWADTLYHFYSVAGPKVRIDKSRDLGKHLAGRSRHSDRVWETPLGREILPVAEGLPHQEWSIVGIGFRGAAIGRVFLVDRFSGSDDSVQEVAESLPDFLHTFEDIRPAWARLIEAGDLDGVVRWLQAGGDLNERYQERPAAEVTPLIQAMIDDQPDIIRELVRRRATVPEDLWDTYEDLIPDPILPLVDPSRARPDPS